MPEKTLDETILQKWIGKTETLVDVLDVKQARLMEALMDRDPVLKTGDPLPPAWNWIYFLTTAPMSGLGRDGHPALGEFLPPVALPRRMWAGGRFSFIKPVFFGEQIEKTSTIKNVVLKSGSSGSLCFVTVGHEYRDQQQELRFTEEHDIVYRQDPAPDAPAPKPSAPPARSVSSETIVPSEVQLFRYSALTFNSHRIHYDRNYCINVEGYPGLIFHGPLSATLLADRAQQFAGDRVLKTFNFRAAAPLFDTEPFTLHHDGQSTFWTQTPDGGLAMKADVEFS